MSTTTPTRPPAMTAPSRRVALLVRSALVASALGLIATGLILLTDPNDQIGAWLQIGIGTGLAVTGLRPAWWAGGLLAAVGTSAGLAVGHLADYYGAGDSTIGPAAIGMTLVLLTLTVIATATYWRSRPVGTAPTRP